MWAAAYPTSSEEDQTQHGPVAVPYGGRSGRRESVVLNQKMKYCTTILRTGLPAKIIQVSFPLPKKQSL